MTDLSAEEISQLRQSLEFDRDRAGMAGCDIRKRAAWLLDLMDLADNFAVDVPGGAGTCLRCRGSGMEPLARCNQCGAVREPWQDANETRCPMHAVPAPYSSCDGTLALPSDWYPRLTSRKGNS